MKIAAIALASAFAAVVGFAQPSFAQQNQPNQFGQQQNQPNQFGQTQYGPGMQGQSGQANSPNGQGNNWAQGNWRGGNEGWRGRRDWDMAGRMEGHMGMWGRHHRRGEEAAHFRFRRGQAMIDVKCPEREPLQACVNAAGQLLDKIANLRNSSASGSTNGLGSESNSASQSNAKPGGSAQDQTPSGSSSGQ